MQAKSLPGYIAVANHYWMEGVSFLEVKISDYDDFAALPIAVEFAGRIYGKSGWNSDSLIAYYRTDWPMAKSIPTKGV